MPLPLDPDKPILLTAQLKLPSMPAKSPGFYHLGTKRSIIASCTAAQSRHGHCILLILADNSGSAQSPAFDALFFAPTVKVLVSDLAGHTLPAFRVMHCAQQMSSNILVRTSSMSTDLYVMYISSSRMAWPDG